MFSARRLTKELPIVTKNCKRRTLDDFLWKLRTTYVKCEMFSVQIDRKDDDN